MELEGGGAASTKRAGTEVGREGERGQEGRGREGLKFQDRINPLFPVP